MTNVTTRAKAAQPQAPAAPSVPQFDADRELTKLRQALEDADKERAQLRQEIQGLKDDRESKRVAIEEIDSYSKGGFGEIGAVARLALLSMERPMTCLEIERIATALEAIWDRACSYEDLINAVAEQAGCPYRDEAYMRRMKAREQDR